MGVNQMPVDPGVGLGRELVDDQFPCGQHDLAVGAINHVAIHVHVVKIIVEPDRLNLAVGLQQRTFIPDSDILDGNIMVPNFIRTQGFIDFKIDFLDIVQIIGFTGKLNIVGDKGRFLGQLIGFDHKLLHQDGKTVCQRQNGAYPDTTTDQDQFQLESKSIVNQK